MEVFNTILLLLGLVAFVMYLKNLFDIKEGAVTNSRKRHRRKHGCRYGYKRKPRYVGKAKGGRSQWRGVDYLGRGRRFRGGNIYDFECKARSKRCRGGGRNKRKQANAARALIAAGAKSFSYTA